MAVSGSGTQQHHGGACSSVRSVTAALSMAHATRRYRSVEMHVSRAAAIASATPGHCFGSKRRWQRQRRNGRWQSCQRQRGRNYVYLRALSKEEGSYQQDSDSTSQVESITSKSAVVVESIFAELAQELSTQPSSSSVNNDKDAISLSSDSGTELRQRIESAIVKLGEGLVERDTECRLLMLGALCGEHVLLIGPPGTAKSELGRRLSTICKQVRYELYETCLATYISKLISNIEYDSFCRY